MATGTSQDYRPQNRWVIAVQLDEQTHNKLTRLCNESKLSKSQLIRLMIAGATLNITAVTNFAERKSGKKAK